MQGKRSMQQPPAANRQHEAAAGGRTGTCSSRHFMQAEADSALALAEMKMQRCSRMLTVISHHVFCLSHCVLKYGGSHILSLSRMRCGSNPSFISKMNIGKATNTWSLPLTGDPSPLVPQCKCLESCPRTLSHHRRG